MALQIERETENGIITNYHRIVSVNTITNWTTTIEVASYVSQKQREKEEQYQTLQRKSMNDELTSDEQKELNLGVNVFIDTHFYQIPYDKKLNVDGCYEYLKTLDEYKNAKDV